MKKISLLLPTRERPAQLLRFIDSLESCTTDLSHIEVILYIDEDDVSTRERLFNQNYIKTIIDKRGTMGFYNSECLRRATGEIVMLVNDDIIIHTKNWDNIVRQFVEKFPDEIYLAYPNDLFYSEKCSTFPILSRKSCELLQEPYPVLYYDDLIDLHLMDVFQRLRKAGFDRIFYLNDVVFEHINFFSGKAKNDDVCHKKTNILKSDAIFLALLKQRRNAVKKLVAVIKGKPESIETVKSENCKITPLNNWVCSFVRYFKAFILDFQLPLKWRSYLWYLFMARFYSVKIKPIVKKVVK